MKNTFLCLAFMLMAGLSSFSQQIQNKDPQNEAVSSMLDTWHKAAADANFEEYFDLIAEDGIFIGTDPTENWTKSEFQKWSKPYFDEGKAWNFKALQRNIFLAESGDLAWFDELLETQMGICRGSGVAKKIEGEWKVQHYVLSIEIPNESVDEVTKIKQDFDQKLMKKFKSE